MKEYKKSKLKFSNGFITTKKGKIIIPSDAIVSKLNQLEALYQKAIYNTKYKNDTKQIKVPDFEFESACYSPIKLEHCETPLLDERTKVSMQILNEIKANSFIDKTNDLIKEYADVYNWVASDTVINNGGIGLKFDLKYIGNPLCLDEEMLTSILAVIASDDTVTPETKTFGRIHWTPNPIYSSL